MYRYLEKAGLAGNKLVKQCCWDIRMKTKNNRMQKIVYCFVIVAKYILGIVFLISSISKIQQPYTFLGDIYSYEIVGPDLGVFSATIMPWAELFVGICLLGSVCIAGSLILATGMGMVFVIVLSWAIYHGLDIGCGCFGNANEKITLWTMIRAILIVMLSLFAYFGKTYLELQRSGN